MAIQVQLHMCLYVTLLIHLSDLILKSEVVPSLFLDQFESIIIECLYRMYDRRTTAFMQDQNFSKCITLKKIHNGQSLALVSNSICYMSKGPKQTMFSYLY